MFFDALKAKFVSAMFTLSPTDFVHICSALITPGQHGTHFFLSFSSNSTVTVTGRQRRNQR
jgi:hypothetical protein